MKRIQQPSGTILYLGLYGNPKGVRYGTSDPRHASKSL